MYQDFPSGHTAAAFAIISVIWLAYPKLLWPSTLFGIAVIIGLLCTNSHYLADCIGGLFLGSSVGFLTTRFFELSSNTSSHGHK